MRSIAKEFNKNSFYDSKSMEDLKLASEVYLRKLLDDTSLLTRHGKRSTMFPEDIKLTLQIKGE